MYFAIYLINSENQQISTVGILIIIKLLDYYYYIDTQKLNHFKHLFASIFRKKSKVKKKKNSF